MSESRTSEKTGKPLPRCKAILLCERTIREAETGKWSLIGIIHKLVFPKLPAVTQPMTAYMELAEGIGSYEISAEIRDLATGQSLAHGGGAKFEFKDRLSVLQINLPLPPLPLHHVGSFEFIVFANDEEIDRQKFEVSCAAAGGGAGS